MRLFWSGRRARREAAEWVARLGGGAGASDHAAFRAWYEADGRNAEAYDRMAAIWAASGKLALPGSRSRERPAARKAWVYALAASILLAGGLVFLLRGVAPGTGEGSIAYATGRSEPREFTLPDGSRVTLDASSRVELAFSGDERRIVLRAGRARFAVAHEARPFIVQAGDSQVVATGTVFDVSLLENKLSVVLVEGAVEVRQVRGAAVRSITRVAAGNRLVIAGETAPFNLPVRPGDTSWARHMLEFDDVPLGEAVAMANRYSERQIKVDDEAVRRLRITGAYRAGDAAGLARGLAAAFALQLSQDGDGSLRLVARPHAR